MRAPLLILLATATSVGCDVHKIWRIEDKRVFLEGGVPDSGVQAEVGVDRPPSPDADASTDRPPVDLCELLVDRGAVCSVGLGVCRRSGTMICRTDGRGLECDAKAGTPGTEVCDADFEDENCDGKTNEGCDCRAGAVDRPCAARPGFCNAGVQRCTDGKWSDCVGGIPGPAEICNGKDDDCDGLADEDFEVGRACVEETDGCKKHGVTVCTTDGRSTRCDATIVEAQPETCNGKDDDCDEMIDNLGGPCGMEGGVCRIGTRICSGGQEVCLGGVFPTDELCNDKDDNCNDKTDELYEDKGKPCVVGIGACRRNGAFICRPDGRGVVCDAKPGEPATAESCDDAYEDENCDGRSNEGCECGEGAADRPCLAQAGVCDPGVLKCVAGRWTGCLGVVAGAVETCNGKDDNCDGYVDEPYGDKDQPCVVGVGACRRTGTFACRSDGRGVACSASPGAPAATEICDAAYQDENCDGRTNEGCECVEGAADRPCLSRPGLCDPGVLRCVDGHWVGCEGVVAGATETCNGKDDNCDGQVDEPFADKNQSCAVGIGACRRTGTFECRSDGRGVVCSASPGPPAATEICDAAYQDENCDGRTNEGCECVQGVADRPCQPQTGLCNPGVMKCVGARWTGCEGVVAAVAETCNGKDDDCDGTVDNLAGSCGMTGGACRPGTRACSGGQEVCVGGVLPSDELCNGIDDNCNGQVDELHADRGRPCDVGLGACKRTGRFICRSDGRGVVCDASPGPATPEICDAGFQDENCDGRSNEGCECTDGTPDRPCPPPPGTCAPGVQRCVGGRWGDCIGGGTPPPETCNRKDDNCDGRVDEGFDTGRSCSTETAGCRRYGTIVCAGDGMTTVCDATLADVRLETCNGLDDDCNGVIDDVVRSPCGVTGGICRLGTRACSNGQEVCQGAIPPSEEVCNGLDDDCDGRTDEVFDVDVACEVGIGACRRTGTRRCAPNGIGTVCGVAAGLPQPESCNGLDDNCDGLADYTVNADGTLSSACGCDRQPVTPSQGDHDRFERAASASLCPVVGGVASMQYFQGSCVDPYPFSQCIFTTVDLTDFDADHLGLGALEISFTLAQTTYTEVNFYYGVYPRRKLLRPFSFGQAQAGIGPGCYRVVFAPSHAICPTYTEADLKEPAFAGFDKACITGCTAGRWGDKSPACVFSYANTTLYGTVEQCARDNQTGTIGNIKIRRHGTTIGPNCLCGPGQGCKDLSKPICDTRAALPAAGCAPGVRCGGVCVSDAENADACLYDPAEDHK